MTLQTIVWHVLQCRDGPALAELALQVEPRRPPSLSVVKTNQKQSRSIVNGKMLVAKFKRHTRRSWTK